MSLNGIADIGIDGGSEQMNDGPGRDLIFVRVEREDLGCGVFKARGRLALMKNDRHHHRLIVELALARIYLQL